MCCQQTLLFIFHSSLTAYFLSFLCILTNNYTQTHTRARGGARGAFGPPFCTTPPVGKVDFALQLTACVYCGKARSTLPTGGVVREGGPPCTACARVCVWVCVYSISQTWVGGREAKPPLRLRMYYRKC